MSEHKFVKLKNRGLIKISGPDRRTFLQGLTSNDVNLLDKQPLIYTCLLTPNGKFLFDFFVSEQNDTLLLDCEGGERAQDFLKRLQMFKLRSNITLEVEENAHVFAVFPSSGTPDPRHPDMGGRSYEQPTDTEEQAFEFWDNRRIHLGIPDGSRDMIPEKSTLLECNIDKFNGISWDKGCYMGQELTARMNYRGLVKKRLYAIEFESTPPAPFTDILYEGKVIGEMRSSCEKVGLAHIKEDKKDLLKRVNINVLAS